VRRGGNQGQLVVYQLATMEEETHRSPNFAGPESNFAGASRPLRGPAENNESPAMARLTPSTSRLRGNAYKEAEAHGVPQTPIVVTAKSNGANGHGLAKHAAVK
jgi:hypothetical protein